MPFYIVRNDITKMPVDAIVNAANETLLGGGGVDGAIHAAAGPRLLAECRTLGGCRTGEAKLTKGYDLPCRYVIHTVGPVWHGGNAGEEQALESCFRSSLALAAENGCETLAFPLISSGVYGYPKEAAFRVAEDTIRAFLETHDMTVYLVLFDRASFTVGKALAAEIRSYIDDRYADAHADSPDFRRKNSLLSGAVSAPVMPAAEPEAFMAQAANKPKDQKKSGFLRRKAHAAEETAAAEILCDEGLPLDDLVRQIDESFSEMLLRKIDEKGMTDAACYKKANIDRKLFSKIRSDRFYKPSKPTVLCFAIALELPLCETKEMLTKAGYALSHSNIFDIIVEYFISSRIYDIIEINNALFSYDQPLLGM